MALDRTVRSFWRSRPNGSVSMAGGLMLTMVAGALGAALDYSNAHSRRVDLQSAADAAALAGAANPSMSKDSIRKLAEWDLSQVPLLKSSTVVVERTDDGLVQVEITGASKTSLLQIIGYEQVEVFADAKAMFVPLRGGKLEVAMVLDTTQSMADDMGALRSSAKDLASTLFNVGGEENVKVSVVPYVASVNIGNGSQQMAWMDTAGTTQYHGYVLEDRTVTSCLDEPDDDDDDETCWTACGCGGKPPCGGGDDGASLSGGDDTKFADSLLNRLLGSSAHAAALPYATPDPEVCPIKTPDEVNHFDLFDAIPNAEWMGCVEARPAPFDVTDAAPGSAWNSRFVPYFWPDEADRYDDEPWANNYALDTLGPDFNPDVQYLPTWGGRNLTNIWKYDNVTSANVLESTSDILGPNRACPDPMLPLNNDRDVVDAKISSLTHRQGGGTVISEGLMWGWRALSPGEPFAEGVDYDDETRKIIIILSDGSNQVIARNESSGDPADDTLGDYTAYGFANEYNQEWPSRGLIDTSTNTSTPYFDQVRAGLNERTSTACTNIKAAGTDDNKIEIYTVLVGDSDMDTEELMASCATTRANHYKEASDMAELQETFNDVGQQIAGSGSSRLVH